MAAHLSLKKFSIGNLQAAFSMKTILHVPSSSNCHMRPNEDVPFTCNGLTAHM